jgi:GTP-binding protein
VFSEQVHFLAASDKPSNLPSEGPPEIAFSGRSNVGKSSLLNALTGQKNLARSGKTPGLTRALIFFTLSNGVRLVDFPGYGYNDAKPHITKQSQQLAAYYLFNRRPLRLICLLIDIRRGIMDIDKTMIKQIITAEHQGLVIATKADRLPPSLRAEQIEAINNDLKHHAPHFPKALPTSAHKGIGIDAVQGFLEQIVKL